MEPSALEASQCACACKVHNPLQCKALPTNMQQGVQGCGRQDLRPSLAKGYAVRTRPAWGSSVGKASFNGPLVYCAAAKHVHIICSAHGLLSTHTVTPCLCKGIPGKTYRKTTIRRIAKKQWQPWQPMPMPLPSAPCWKKLPRLCALASGQPTHRCYRQWAASRGLGEGNPHHSWKLQPKPTSTTA